MVQIEHLQDGQLVRHYSDEGRMLRQVETDILYAEAVDVVPCPYTYEETDQVIEVTDEVLAVLEKYGYTK